MVGRVWVTVTGALTCMSEKKWFIIIPTESCSQLLLMMSRRSCSASSFRVSHMSHRRSRKSWTERDLTVTLQGHGSNDLSAITLKSFACLKNVPKANLHLMHFIQQMFIWLLVHLRDTKSYACVCHKCTAGHCTRGGYLFCGLTLPPKTLRCTQVCRVKNCSKEMERNVAVTEVLNLLSLFFL